LLTKDHSNYKQHLAEIDDLKLKLAEVTDELDEYKKYSVNNPMSNKIDIDKEMREQERFYKNKIESSHQQIDTWKNKFRDSDQK
jgi:hypothetical protein